MKKMGNNTQNAYNYQNNSPLSSHNAVEHSWKINNAQKIEQGVGEEG